MARMGNRHAEAKTDEADRRTIDAAAGASAGTPPGDLAHELELLGAALRLTPEQRAAARLSVGAVLSRADGDR